MEVVGAATSVGAEAVLFSGAGSILVAVASLATELYASREMCEDLIKSVSDLQAPLEKLLTNGNVSITRHALELYKKLVDDLHAFLQDHVRSSKIARLAKHWSMKDRIKDFYVERERIGAILQLEFIEESASNHVQLTQTVQGLAERNARIDQQHQHELAKLETMIKDIPMATVVQLGEQSTNDDSVKVALADLKNEIKTSAAAYSNQELDMMKQLFLAGCASYKIPRESLSLPQWYISRSDVRFTHANPFASGEFHSLHYGTLLSGARVAVNIVNSDPNDEKSRERFVREVTTLSLLRDPHILAFYGANHVGSPLMYVTAHAERGDFGSYLRVHRDRFWQLFLDAARGLAYLHKNKVVHGNLKCSNLLVLADGTGVVSDFMFAFVRASSVLSLKTKPTTYDWTAPECLGVGTEANPTFESDVYALGMCLIEAATGKRPYHDVADDSDARERIRTGQLPNWAAQYNVPEPVTELVAKMCTTEHTERIRLSEVISILQVLAAQEQITRQAEDATCDAAALCSGCGKRAGTP